MELQSNARRPGKLSGGSGLIGNCARVVKADARTLHNSVQAQGSPSLRSVWDRAPGFATLVLVPSSLQITEA